MKKFMMLALVLTMILGLNGVIMASDVGVDCWPDPIPECLVGTVNITADVPFYAQVKVDDNLELTINPEGPCDGDNATATGDVNFTIRINHRASVKAELQGLKNTSWSWEHNNIPTTATITRWGMQPLKLTNQNRFGEFELSKGDYWSGRGVYNLNASILGQLGRIEDQAMGHYKGKLTLTVVPPEV